MRNKLPNLVIKTGGGECLGHIYSEFITWGADCLKMVQVPSLFLKKILWSRTRPKVFGFGNGQFEDKSKARDTLIPPFSQYACRVPSWIISKFQHSVRRCLGPFCDDSAVGPFVMSVTLSVVYEGESNENLKFVIKNRNFAPLSYKLVSVLQTACRMACRWQHSADA